MLLTLALTVALASPCPEGTAVVMQCPAKKKQIAVCVDAAATPRFAEYRFGAPATIASAPELAVRDDGFRTFAFARRTLATGSVATLTVTNGATRYEVYTQDGKDGGGGVNVLDGDKVSATVGCSGDYEEHWERLEAALSSTPSATSSTSKPDPLAGKSMKEICSDDVLLLTRYGWDDLRFKGAFKSNCCVAGALGVDDDRCELDWPSSDVPECDFFDELRNGVFARYGYVFKDARWQKHFGALPWYAPRADFDNAWLPAVAQANVLALKAFACPKAASSTACEQAGLRYSLDLQKGAKGQMDGVQQSEIAEVLVGLCKAGWSEDAAACFAAGKHKACKSKLRDAQFGTVLEEVRKISVDAPLD